MTSARREQIIESLRNKQYRDAFVEEQIDTGVAFQIRAMRAEREWPQQELGKRTGKAQETISQLEDPDYGRATLGTLKRLASAFDVALIVRFAPFSELVDYVSSLSFEHLAVPAFAADRLLTKGAGQMIGSTVDQASQQSITTTGALAITTLQETAVFFLEKLPAFGWSSILLDVSAVNLNAGAPLAPPGQTAGVAMSLGQGARDVSSGIATSPKSRDVPSTVAA